MADALRLTVIILAAGGSKRLGKPKQLVSWRGRTLVEQIVSRALAVSTAGVVLVTGAAAQEVAATIRDKRVCTVFNEDWQLGISSSLRAGLAVVGADVDGVLVLLCDQPLVTQQDISRLIDVWENHPASLVGSDYNGVTGVPAIFPKAFLQELQLLGGDMGAGGWLRQRDDVISVAMPNASIDVDTNEDLQKLREKE
jgi:molybdenum cofactor cytidylyltransferase